MGIANDLILIIFAALVGGIIVRFLGQPLVLGYIIAGIVVGPHTAGWSVQGVHDIEMLAEIGVALLLFSLGLEFSLSELKRLARIALIATPLQLLLCGVVGYFLATLLGLPWQESVWFGAIISLSSTMVVLKSLSSQGAQDSQAGHLMVTMLIAQDLAIIPIMLLLPQLTGGDLNIQQVTVALGTAFGTLFAVYILGHKLLPRLLAMISQWGSRELFFVSILVIALGLSYLTHLAGLSFAFGAFVAGIILSESDFNHQALSDISSLRDLFGLVFFVSVGMLFNPLFLVEQWQAVLLITGTLVISKAVITGLLIRALGYSGILSFSVGIGLSQIGEFAFLIANAGLQGSFVSQNTYSLVIASTICSMIATPVLLRFSPRLYRAIRGQRKNAEPLVPALSMKEESQGHVVIVGGSPSGEYVAKVLGDNGAQSVIIEIHHEIAAKLRAQGYYVILGDGAHPIILHAARIESARLLIVTVSNSSVATQIIAGARSINPQIRCIARVDKIEDARALLQLGVHEVVQPQREAGLEMVRQSLLALGRDESGISSLLGRIRLSQYEPEEVDSSVAVGKSQRSDAARMLEFGWFEIQTSSDLCGQTIESLKLRDKFGVSVVGVIRGDEVVTNPGGKTVVNPGDTYGVVGTRTSLEQFKQAVA